MLSYRSKGFEAGEKVENSKYYRAYCGVCREAIRVPEHVVLDDREYTVFCDQCDVFDSHVGNTNPAIPLSELNYNGSSWLMAEES